MEDVFYFTKAAVGSQDIVDLAATLGMQVGLVELPTEIVPRVNVNYGTPAFAQFTFLDREKDLVNFEPDDLPIIREYDPKTIVMVSHHPLAWPQLVPLLKRLLETQGGWIGCDADAFEPVFTAHTIEATRYPLLEPASGAV